MAAALHELPLKVDAFPSWSTAAQNDADGHDTERKKGRCRIEAAEQWVGALHALPLNVNASSVAVHGDAERRQTGTRPS